MNILLNIVIIIVFPFSGNKNFLFSKKIPLIIKQRCDLCVRGFNVITIENKLLVLRLGLGRTDYHIYHTFGGGK